MSEISFNRGNSREIDNHLWPRAAMPCSSDFPLGRGAVSSLGRGAVSSLGRGAGPVNSVDKRIWNTINAYARALGNNQGVAAILADGLMANAASYIPLEASNGREDAANIKALGAAFLNKFSGSAFVAEGSMDFKVGRALIELLRWQRDESEIHKGLISAAPWFKREASVGEVGRDAGAGQVEHFFYEHLRDLERVNPA